MEQERKKQQEEAQRKLEKQKEKLEESMKANQHKSETKQTQQLPQIQHNFTLQDLGETFDAKHFYSLIGIDDSELPLGSKIMTQRKARHLWESMIQVKRLEKEIESLTTKSEPYLPVGVPSRQYRVPSRHSPYKGSCASACDTLPHHPQR